MAKLAAKTSRIGKQGSYYMAKQDMTQANGTFSAFTALMKWGTIASAIVAFIVVLIIS